MDETKEQLESERVWFMQIADRQYLAGALAEVLAVADRWGFILSVCLSVCLSAKKPPARLGAVGVAVTRAVAVAVAV